jgi:hypothetical protein
MRLVALLLLLGSNYPLDAAEVPNDVTDAPPASVRKEMLSEYKFEVPAKDPTQPTASSNSSQTLTTVPQDPNLVQMAPYTVRESANMDALHADIVAQMADARTEGITRKLGIGMHVAPVGRLGLYAVTVFYIPIQVGFGFSF